MRDSLQRLVELAVQRGARTEADAAARCLVNVEDDGPSVHESAFGTFSDDMLVALQGFDRDACTSDDLAHYETVSAWFVEWVNDPNADTKFIAYLSSIMHG